MIVANVVTTSYWALVLHMNLKDRAAIDYFEKRMG
jgi:hypothetical protein